MPLSLCSIAPSAGPSLPLSMGSIAPSGGALDALLDVPLDGLRRNRIDRNKLSDWLYEHEFWSILRPGKAKAKFF